MAPTKPALARAAPGMPISVEGWNKVVDAIDTMYGALTGESNPYLEVAVRWRGRSVRDARVIAIPVDPSGKPTGPALEAAAPTGDIATHRVAGARPGRWELCVEAPGFSARSLSVEAATPPGGGPLEPAVVDLTRATVPVPDLVGLGYWGAIFALTWGRLAPLQDETIDQQFRDSANTSVLFQGPCGVDIERETRIHAVLAGTSVPQRPWRAIVPDLTGSPAATLGAYLTGYFRLQVGQADFDSGPKDGMRVVAQSPTPGEVVPADTKVDIRAGNGDPSSALFGTYPSTHGGMAKVLLGSAAKTLNDVVTQIDQKDLPNNPLWPNMALWTPWEIARTYFADADLATVIDFFVKSFKLTITDAPGQDLAAVWSSFVVTAAMSIT